MTAVTQARCQDARHGNVEQRGFLGTSKMGLTESKPESDVSVLQERIPFHKGNTCV